MYSSTVTTSSFQHFLHGCARCSLQSGGRAVLSHALKSHSIRPRVTGYKDNQIRPAICSDTRGRIITSFCACMCQAMAITLLCMQLRAQCAWAGCCTQQQLPASVLLRSTQGPCRLLAHVTQATCHQLRLFQYCLRWCNPSAVQQTGDPTLAQQAQTEQSYGQSTNTLYTGQQPCNCYVLQPKQGV